MCTEKPTLWTSYEKKIGGKIFKKKNSGRTMSENLRGGQRPENWLGRIMSENIQGGRCPEIKGGQCPEIKGGQCPEG